VLGTPGVDGLSEAVGALREWQYDGAPMQLHPGDLGWFWRFGAEATAAAVRTWSRGGRTLAVGLLDSPTLLRLTIAPDAVRDEELARRLVEDVTEPERGVLPDGKVSIEAPAGALVQELLVEAGWKVDEPWTPLRRDLTEPVQHPGVRTVQRGDVPRPHFVRAVCDQLRAHPRRVGGLPAPFGHLPGGAGDPVHRGHRAPVPAFVQLTGPDLGIARSWYVGLVSRPRTAAHSAPHLSGWRVDNGAPGISQSTHTRHAQTPRRCVAR